MSDKMIMQFHIFLYPNQISEVNTKSGKAKMIPFGGWVKSDLFSGKILPGGVDVQVTNAAGIRHMCARYMFKGTDYTGAECSLFVDNNGYFEATHQAGPFETCPTFLTDSEALADYLHGTHFRAEGCHGDDGLSIYVYDTEKSE